MTKTINITMKTVHGTFITSKMVMPKTRPGLDQDPKTGLAK